MLYFRHFYDHSHYNENSILLMAQASASKTIMVPDVTNLLFSLKPIHHLSYSEKLMKQFNVSLGKECENFKKYFTPTYMLKYDFENSKEKMIKYIEEKGI